MSDRSHEEQVTADFGPEEYERLANAARLAGKPIGTFVHDAATTAAADVFIKALERASHSAEHLAEVFAEAETGAAGTTPSGSWPQTPLGSRDLRAAEHRGNRAA